MVLVCRAACGCSTEEIYDDLSSDGIEVDIWNVDYAEASMHEGPAEAPSTIQ